MKIEREKVAGVVKAYRMGMSPQEINAAIDSTRGFAAVMPWQERPDVQYCGECGRIGYVTEDDVCPPCASSIRGLIGGNDDT